MLTDLRLWVSHLTEEANRAIESKVKASETDYLVWEQDTKHYDPEPLVVDEPLDEGFESDDILDTRSYLTVRTR